MQIKLVKTGAMEVPPDRAGKEKPEFHHRAEGLRQRNVLTPCAPTICFRRVAP